MKKGFFILSLLSLIIMFLVAYNSQKNELFSLKILFIVEIIILILSIFVIKLYIKRQTKIKQLPKTEMVTMSWRDESGIKKKTVFRLPGYKKEFNSKKEAFEWWNKQENIN